MPRLATLASSLLLAACAAPAGSGLLASSGPQRPPSAPPQSSQEPFPFERRPQPLWRPGAPLMHGFLGVSMFEEVEVDDGGPGSVDGDRGDLDEIPLIGGGAQWKMGGERVDYGFEGLMSFSWRGDAEVFVIVNGAAAVAIDVDLLLFELYGGPFLSTFLGEKLRVYGAAGPLMRT